MQFIRQSTQRRSVNNSFLAVVCCLVLAQLPSQPAGAQYVLGPAVNSEGSTLRLRWIADADIDGATRRWTFGLDNVEFQLGLVGDLHRDGVLGVEDIDLLSSQIELQTNDVAYDLNGDQEVTTDDLHYLLQLSNRDNGDANFDGTVDFADFLVLSNNFGSTSTIWSQGDFDSDGTIEFSDFLILASNFGQKTVSTAAVPEPGTSYLAALAVMGLLTRRRQM